MFSNSCYFFRLLMCKKNILCFIEYRLLIPPSISFHPIPLSLSLSLFSYVRVHINTHTSVHSQTNWDNALFASCHNPQMCSDSGRCCSVLRFECAYGFVSVEGALNTETHIHTRTHTTCPASCNRLSSLLSS